MLAIAICLVLLNVYLDHLKLFVVCFNGWRYVCCGECYVVSNKCNDPTSCLVQPIVARWCECMYFGCFDFRGELGLLNWDDICMCVYVDLQYDEISFTFTGGSVCLCGVCSPVVVFGLFVRLSWYPMLWVRAVVAVTVMYVLFFCVGCVYAAIHVVQVFCLVQVTY